MSSQFPPRGVDTRDVRQPPGCSVRRSLAPGRFSPVVSQPGARSLDPFFAAAGSAYLRLAAVLPVRPLTFLIARLISSDPRLAPLFRVCLQFITSTPHRRYVPDRPSSSPRLSPDSDARLVQREPRIARVRDFFSIGLLPSFGRSAIMAHVSEFKLSASSADKQALPELERPAQTRLDQKKKKLLLWSLTRCPSAVKLRGSHNGAAAGSGRQLIFDNSGCSV